MTPEREAEIRQMLAMIDANYRLGGGDETLLKIAQDLLAALDAMTKERDVYRDHPAILVPASPTVKEPKT